MLDEPWRTSFHGGGDRRGLCVDLVFLGEELRRGLLYVDAVIVLSSYNVTNTGVDGYEAELIVYENFQMHETHNLPRRRSFGSSRNLSSPDCVTNQKSLCEGSREPRNIRPAFF